MHDNEAAARALRALERPHLEGLMLALARSHAAACRVTSQEIDEHASEATMKERVGEMSMDELVDALAPMAAIGQLAHEHHPEHAEGHGSH